MIGQLRGTIIDRQPPHLLLDVNGVGYDVAAPMDTFYHFADCHSQVRLWIHTVVREDTFALYGFHESNIRDCFRTLIKANGVGPKLALTILSGIAVGGLVQAIHAQDVSRLTAIPGIGKKTAERLLIELRDKADHWENNLPVGDKAGADDATQIALDALQALGYKNTEARRAIQKVDSEQSSENMIRQALKNLTEA